MELFFSISDHIRQVTGNKFRLRRHRSLGGGCINRSGVLEGEREGISYFVKLNSASRLHMFEAEADGLNELSAASPLRVPAPVCSGIHEETAYLVLEFIDFPGGAGSSAHYALGRDLAVLHGTRSGRFGWHRDNTIGSTPQPNCWSDNWVEFYREMRLGHQFSLAADKGMDRKTLSAGYELLDDLERYFIGYSPEASLLHGDLWGGNFAVDTEDRPVIFDPATYYGDREADIAMTELFGGFDSSFYQGYCTACPLHEGYETRKTLYNLYHVLNHFNLFGGGYASRAGLMIDDLLASPPV